LGHRATQLRRWFLASSAIIAAPFSAIMIVGALALVEVPVDITQSVDDAQSLSGATVARGAGKQLR
jgi:hypothetical protein